MAQETNALKQQFKAMMGPNQSYSDVFQSHTVDIVTPQQRVVQQHFPKPFGESPVQIGSRQKFDERPEGVQSSWNKPVHSPQKPR